MRILYLLLPGLLWANAEVDAIFAPYTKPGSPGCAVGVMQDGKTVLAKGYGLADLDQGIPITPRTRFYMASVSKQFTSLALLIAEKEGKLKLDDSIRKWVPEMPAYAEGITIRRMLDHTSGLRDYLALWGMRGFSNESVLKLAPTLDLIARQEGLNFPIGTGYSYSNSGYLLAAVALERATGRTLAQWTQEKIHGPLEMQASRFQDDHGLPVPDRAHGYRRAGGFRTTDVGFDLVGSGGMYSNIEDMLKWARNFEDKSVAGDVVAKLYTPGKLVDGTETPGGYALGMIQKNGFQYHSGGATGYSTFFLRVPEKRLGIVCLCNVGGAAVQEHASRVAEVFGAKGLERPRRNLPGAVKWEWKPGVREQFAGRYWSEELEAMWTFRMRGSSLNLITPGDSYEVKPGPDGTFQAGGFEIRPIDASSFEVVTGRARGVRFQKR